MGFTLFELVVLILVVAIVFAYGLNRFREFPGEAERANFLAVSTQLKAGVTLQMMNGIASGKWNELSALEGSNPMDLMLELPRNYLGAFDLIDEAALPRRTWYFDSFKGNLIYLADDSENLYSYVDGFRQPTDQVSFRIVMKYDDGKDDRQGSTFRRGDIDNLFAENDAFALNLGEETGSSAAETTKKPSWVGLLLEPLAPYQWNSIDVNMQNVVVPQ